MEQEHHCQEVGAERRDLCVGGRMWHLDADLFLDKYPRLEAGSPQHPYLLQVMFVHVKAAGQKEYEWAIHQGCQQLSPELDTEAIVPAIQLTGFKTMRDEIQGLYNEVYQLKRSPGPLLCSTEELTQEILSSLKEHLS